MLVIKFALALIKFLFEVRKELVLDRNKKDKDAQGLSGLRTVHQF